MQKSHWHSLRWIHQLYRRHTINRLVRFIGLGTGLVVLSFQLLFFSTQLFQLQYAGINGLFVLSSGLLVWFLVDSILAWGQEGFRIRTFFQRWEEQHPEINNRASLLVYAEKSAGEIERLGYSQDLIQADDEWLKRYLAMQTQREKRAGSMMIPIFFALVVFPSLFLLIVQKDTVRSGWESIAQALWMVPPTVDTHSIVTAETITAARGEPAVLKATWSNPDPEQEAWIHFRSRTQWNRQSVRVDGNQLVFIIPSVNREMEYFFSAGGALSNKGYLTPIDPPSLAQGRMIVVPPAYTGLPLQTTDRLKPLSVPKGSMISIVAQASTRLVSATVYFASTAKACSMSEDSLETSFKIEESGDLFFEMEDENGLIGRSRRYRMTTIADASPTLEVITPQPISMMPNNMQLRVQLHAKDDYRLEKLFKHMQINEETDDQYTFLVWSNTPINAASDSQVSVTTELFVSYDWNLAEHKLYPGDEVKFTLEVFDNDVQHGPNSFRTPTFLVKYPTLAELLSLLDQMEEKQVADLDKLVDQQKQITEDAQKTLEKLSEKIQKREKKEDSKEENTWMEEKELESIKERQEELIEDAKKIEEQLEEYQQKAQETAQEDQSQGFTPETLEKIEKIQELMKQLMDKDSQSLLQKIDQTLEQMSTEISQEQIEELKFSFEDYNQQLDRTLSMLENTFQSRQLEGLKQMADEMAQRQDHLQRETENLEKDQEALAQEQQTGDSDELQKKQKDLDSQKKQLENRQEQLEQDTQSLMDAMQEMQKSLQENQPAVAQALEKMQQDAQEQGLQNEMSEATQKMKSGDLKEAQKNQKKSQQILQSMASQMQEQMFDMGGMNMQQDTQALTRMIQQGLFLSNQMESLTESTLGRSDGLDALRRAQAFQREMDRIDAKWQEIAKTNPFMSRNVEQELRMSNQRLGKAISAGRGEKWVGLHETRGSMVALNSALYQMMQDMQNMQQQMSQSQSQSMQQQMQQMISQQQSLQQMLQQLKQMGQQGEKMMEQMKQMAQQQAKIRKEIEKMMQQNRHAQQLRNQLDGIYQEMKEVEKMLEEGTNDERMDEKQKRIMTRMLEAGTMQENEDYGEEREEEVAKTGLDAQSPTNSGPVTLPEKTDRFIERPPDESIPLPYREALKKYYIRLSEQAVQ